MNAYEFKLPTITRSWCTNIKNEIVNPDGTAWSGSAKLTTQVQPATFYTIWQTTLPVIFSFKVLSTFTNS